MTDTNRLEDISALRLFLWVFGILTGFGVFVCAPVIAVGVAMGFGALAVVVRATRGIEQRDAERALRLRLALVMLGIAAIPIIAWFESRALACGSAVGATLLVLPRLLRDRLELRATRRLLDALAHDRPIEPLLARPWRDALYLDVAHSLFLRGRLHHVQAILDRPREQRTLPHLLLQLEIYVATDAVERARTLADSIARLAPVYERMPWYLHARLRIPAGEASVVLAELGEPPTHPDVAGLHALVRADACVAVGDRERARELVGTVDDLEWIAATARPCAAIASELLAGAIAAPFR